MSTPLQPPNASIQLPARSLLIEIWTEHREVLKALITDVLLFVFVLGILTCVHQFVQILPYPPERKRTIDAIHFFAYVIVLMMFAFDLVLTLALHTFRRRNRAGYAQP
jgi:hypothetical protein